MRKSGLFIVYLLLFNSSFAQVYTDASGNVGIGTQVPGYKLEVSNGVTNLKSSSYGIPPMGSTGSGTSLFVSNYNNLYGLLGGVQGNGSGWLQVQRVDGTATAYNLLLQPNGGNVGIGTATPQQKLHVAGTIKVGSYTFITEPNAGLASVFGSNLYAGVTKNTLVRQNNSDPGSYISMRYDRGIIFGTGVTSTAGVEVADDINERMRIDLNGNVGIGTSSPGTFKLAVEGKLGARKVVVTQVAPWPDYVFAPAYKLPSLKEVEQYIQSNRHLPDVPSAEEVEKGGIDLGDNQAILLKKIEELTLYIIEQNKQLQSEQQKNNTLEDRLNKIEALLSQSKK